MFSTANTHYTKYLTRTHKLSYSCCPNLEQTITAHNKSVASCNTASTSQAGCNCKNVEMCPLPRECTTPNIMYQANVSVPSKNAVEKYVGIFSTTFKPKYYNDLASFRHPTKRLQTELSKYIWSLGDRGLDFTIGKVLKKLRHIITSLKAVICAYGKNILFCTSHGCLLLTSAMTFYLYAGIATNSYSIML